MSLKLAYICMYKTVYVDVEKDRGKYSAYPL